MPVYQKLAECGWDPAALPGYETQLVAALELDLRDVVNSYTALHSLSDFVSGMTDRYAVRVADML